MNPLLFRRQFLLTPRTVDSLDGWTQISVRSHNVYAHPELPVTVHGDESSAVQLVLLGYALDPEHPEDDDARLLERLANSWDGDVSRWELTGFTGRFVLAVFAEGDLLLVADPCGLRTLEYVWEDGLLHAASQALLLERAVAIERGSAGGSTPRCWPTPATTSCWT